MNCWIDAMFRLTFRLGPVVLGLWLWSLALPAAATPTLEQEQEIRASFVTPHTKWAKPYAGGTTRVLFFSDYKNTQAREIVELMQRFEVRADAAYYTRVKVAKKPQRQWHGGEEGIARIRRLLDSGAHDVFLFNGVSPDVLPAAVKQDLLARVARVARGKGLVLVGVKQRGRLDPPLENDPDRVALDEPLILDAPVARQVERGDPEAELFALKQGRAARLPATPVTEYGFGWEIPYDHWQERLGRTVLWAAGKLPAPPLQLRRDSGTDTGITAQSSPDARLVVTLPADMGIRPELWNHGFEPPRRCAPPLLVQGGENLQRQPECYGSIAQVRIRERREDGLVVRDGIPHSPPWLRRGGAERRGGSPIPAEELEVTGPAAGRYYDEVIATDAANSAGHG